MTTKSKQWYKSKTMIFNGALFCGSTFVQIVNVLTGANLLDPLIKTFVKDPNNAAHVITVITQVYSVINIYLRTKTSQPITFNKPTK